MRLAIKSCSYGIAHMLAAIGVAYAITGNLLMALGIGLIEPLVQVAVFALHEYVWERRRTDSRTDSRTERPARVVRTMRTA